MDSSLKMKTPQSHQKMRGKRLKTSGRNSPEGDSIIQKAVFKLQNTPTCQKSGQLRSAGSSRKKKGMKHKLVADNGDVLNASVASKRSYLSDESEYDVDAPGSDDSLGVPTPSSGKMRLPQKVLQAKCSTRKKLDETDVSWEKAVQQARGLPDGAFDDEETASSKLELHKDKAIDSGKRKGSQDKKSNFEKGKKKPLNSTAKKLKNVGGKQQCLGTKRKVDGTSQEELAPDPKKTKLEEMSKKERKKERKKVKNHYEVSTRAKAIWNQLRQINLPVEKRRELSDELHELSKGRVKELIYAHDTSRVVQCLMKYGLQEHKNALFEELKEEIAEMTKSRYAKHFVRKLLKYGTKAQRTYVFRKLHGHVAKLIKHKEAAEIIECAYNDYANASQRAALLEEFYGPSFALFKTTEARSLDEIVRSHPEKREAILRNMKEALSAMVDKTVLRHSIVHRVFLEFFTYATPKLRTEMIETVREGVVEMLHTRDGARVAMICLWYGTAKDRKMAIKSFKSYVCKISCEEYGHLVLLALFDVVDDTKLVQKAILAELLKSISEVAANQYGRKVLLYLLAPRDPLHFHPDIVRVLTEGDDNPTSKKECKVRRKELLEFVSRPLIQYTVKNCRQMVLDNAALLLMVSIMTHVKCDPTDAMRAVSEIAAEPFTAGSSTDKSCHLVEHPAGHLTLKKLIQNDTTRIKAGEEVLFSCILLDILTSGQLKSWAACNRGCFILVSLLELERKEVTSRVQEELASVKKSLRKMDFKGAQVLLNKL